MQDTCKIFFSWQSDVKESRNLISNCLKQVPSRLKELLQALEPEGLKEIYFADVVLKDGEYEVCEESARAVTEYM